jgi:hypothetical protein
MREAEKPRLLDSLDTVLEADFQRSQLKNKVKNLSRVAARSFHDAGRCETVCLLSGVELLGLAGPVVQVCDVPDVEGGEVLVDSRRRGSFQR